MRKGMVWVLALLMLLLAACAQNPEPETELQLAQTENQIAAIEAPAEEELYVEELQWEGMKMKDYYRGGKDGVMYRSDWWADDGRYGVMTFWDNGMMKTSISYDPDGTIHEDECYENGTTKITIYRQADGSVQENHYADDGKVEQVEGFINFYPGTEVYSRRMEADGTVTYERKVEEDGSSWERGIREETRWELRWDREKQITYYLSVNGELVTEFFGEGGKLVKLIDDGTVYEGTAIPEWANSKYAQMQGLE